ncbi:hypothetical protein DFH09DRAFT_1095435 [Mycena vulgaris]|nr:hypothetical protein DFH09DRAFT_1095435 [Mycena vulgaris]
MYHLLRRRLGSRNPKKDQREGPKPRDKSQWTHLRWLHNTIMDWEQLAYISIKHLDDHVPYYSIDLPPEIVDFVHQNHKLTSVKGTSQSSSDAPTDLWVLIAPTPPRVAFHSDLL